MANFRAKKENFAENLPNDSKSEFETLLDDFKVGLVNFGLNNKRVQNPNEFYNSLTALYNAVKK